MWDIMIDRFEKFTFIISSIYRYLHKIMSDEMANHGLKGSHSLYLITMHKNPDGVTSAQICEMCDRNKADVSRAITEMESKGLVVRKSDKNPYRALIKLTDTGIAAAEQIRDKAIIAVKRTGEGLSDEDRKRFYDMLDLISDNLKTMSKEGIPTE